MIGFPAKGVMAIGFDVTHDTSDRSKSYGAFVASMDLKECVKFYSVVIPHKNGGEISQNINTATMAALRAFKTQHGVLPQRIIFYRDGVGDGQIKQVHQIEVASLRQMLDETYAKRGDGQLPKLAFIIVSKRVNTRIFLNKGQNVENPVSGTVVDNCITLPER